MSYPGNLRIFLMLALFACVFFAPPWCVAIVATLLAARWRAWEVVIAGIAMDLLWLPGPITVTSLESFPAATILSIALVFALEPLRRQLLLGPSLL